MRLSTSDRGRMLSVRWGLKILFGCLASLSVAGQASAQKPGAKPAAAPAAPANPAAAQPAPPKISPAADPATFLTIPGYEDTLKKGRTGIMAVLRSGKVNPDQEQFFDTYYSRYSIGRWTVPGNYALLPGFRKELRNDLQLAKVGDAHTRLNDMIFGAMSKIAVANYHPVVRVNAMLMIGDLNSEDPAKPTDLPVPYHQAIPVLLQTVDEPQQLDAVKAAALVGLLRHARLGIRDEARDQVMTSMLNLAKSTGAPGRSVDGHAWLRSQAIEILEVLKSVGPANSVASALTQIAGDQAAPMMVRRAAARAIGRLNFQIAVSFNASATASALARFTIAAAEAARAEAEQHKDTACRRLKSNVFAAAGGINGLADSSKDPAHEKLIASVRDEIARLARACDRSEDDAILAQAGVTAAALRKLAAL
jgi:hypothetical protein